MNSPFRIAISNEPPDPLASGGRYTHDWPDTAHRIPRWKRILDLSIATTAIALLTPVLLVIALWIKATSKGKVLFRQERVGHLGKPFVMLKFRTMNAGADTTVHEQYVSDLIESNKPMTKMDARGDRRLIPGGAFLRASCLDELPQLVNVLRSEMSVVGPRPCLRNEFKRFQAWQQERFTTPPGLTGLWQVSGKNRLTFAEMIERDIHYARNRTLALDLRIILQTPTAILSEIRSARRAAPT